MSTSWQDDFRKVYDHGLDSYRKGAREPEALWTPEQVAWLASIGCTPRELFDFVDDLCRYGEPDYTTALQVTAIRRDYFLTVQGGKPTGLEFPMSRLPGKSETVQGIPWLPRIIEKARVKLRGEMPDDLMYGCGGDRQFLRTVGWTLPDFLTLVRDLDTDSDGIVRTVLAGAKKKA